MKFDIIVIGGGHAGIEAANIASKKQLNILLITNHLGLNSYSAGRAGEPPAPFLAQSMNDFGIKTGRLKTGTSPGIDARTVRFDEMTSQPGDSDPWPFPFSTTETLHNSACAGSAEPIL